MSTAMPPLPPSLLSLIERDHPDEVQRYRNARLRSAPEETDAPTPNAAQAEQPPQERARKRGKKS